jgi:hypothetical protein
MVKRIDWEAVGREYRAGQLSIREIARQYGCSEGLVRSRARDYGWQRDLTDEARREARAKLVEADAYNADNERQAVEDAGERGAQIVRVHRKAIERQRKAADRLIGMVEQWLDLADGQGGEDNKVQADPESLAARMFPGKGDGIASLMQSASSSLDRLVRLERKAYHLDDDESRGDDSDLVNRLEAAQKRAAERGA